MNSCKVAGIFVTLMYLLNCKGVDGSQGGHMETLSTTKLIDFRQYLALPPWRGGLVQTCFLRTFESFWFVAHNVMV